MTIEPRIHCGFGEAAPSVRSVNLAMNRHARGLKRDSIERVVAGARRRVSNPVCLHTRNTGSESVEHPFRQWSEVVESGRQGPCVDFTVFMDGPRPHNITAVAANIGAGEYASRVGNIEGARVAEINMTTSAGAYRRRMRQPQPLRFGYGLIVIEIENHDLGDAAGYDADVAFSLRPFAHLFKGCGLHLKFLPLAKRLLPTSLKREDAPSLRNGRSPDVRQRRQVVHLTPCRGFKLAAAGGVEQVRRPASRSDRWLEAARASCANHRRE